LLAVAKASHTRQLPADLLYFQTGVFQHHQFVWKALQPAEVANASKPPCSSVKAAGAAAAAAPQSMHWLRTFTVYLDCTMNFTLLNLESFTFTCLKLKVTSLGEGNLL
jgi:hypothetical protein